MTAGWAEADPALVATLAAVTRQERLGAADEKRLRARGIAARGREPGRVMLRVRVPGGRLSAAAAAGLAALAGRGAEGPMALTARGQVQLRNVAASAAAGAVERIERLGLSTRQTLGDGLRNLRGCPLAGLGAGELFDATPVLAHLDRRLLAAGLELPRKVNVTVSGCRGRCGDAGTQDVALVAATREGRPGFNLLVGGMAGVSGCRPAEPLDVFVAPTRAAAVVTALVAVYAGAGSEDSRPSARRLGHLLERWGPGRLRDAVERRLDAPLPGAGADARSDRRCDGLGVHRDRRTGRFHVGLHVPLAEITPAELAAAARLARDRGAGELRLTDGQGLVLVGLDDAGAADAVPGLSRLAARPHPLEAATRSCVGVASCPLAAIDTKRHARELTDELVRRVPEAGPLSIRWSACRAGCGHHATADIGLVGRRGRESDGNGRLDVADVYLGGSSGPDPRPAQLWREGVPVGELADVLEPVVRAQKKVSG